MKPVAIVENDPLLPGAGWIARVLDRRGVPWALVRAHAGEMADLVVDEQAALVVLGGRQHAFEEDLHPQLALERRALERAVHLGVPVLGCCLGGQVLARALGGHVTPAAESEHGWLPIEPTAEAADDPLFRHARGGDRVYLWHQDAIDLPPGATLLARSAAATVQAFRLGTAWGLQFHPEVDAATQRTWFASFPTAAADVGLDEAALDAEVAAREGDDGLFTNRLLEAFVDVARA